MGKKLYRGISAVLILAMLTPVFPVQMVLADEQQNDEAMQQTVFEEVYRELPEWAQQEEPAAFTSQAAFVDDSEPYIVEEENGEISLFSTSNSGDRSGYDMIMKGFNGPKLNGESRIGNENISTYTGELTTSFTDLYLPGRNGMDLNLTRIYNSNDTMPDLKYSNNWIEASDDMYSKRRYDIGSGWTWNIPSVEENDEGVFFHTGTGQVYKFNIEYPYLSNLEGYCSNYVRFEKNRSILVDERTGERSKYAFVDEKGVTTYFDQGGLIVLQRDRFGNEINYEREEVPFKNLFRNSKLTKYFSLSGAMQSSSSQATLGVVANDSTRVSGSAVASQPITCGTYYLSMNYRAKNNNYSAIVGALEVNAYVEYTNHSGHVVRTIKTPVYSQSFNGEESGSVDLYAISVNPAEDELAGNIRIEILMNAKYGGIYIDYPQLLNCENQIGRITDSVGRVITFNYENNVYLYSDLDTMPANNIVIKAWSPEGQLIKTVTYYRGVREVISKKSDDSEVKEREHCLYKVNNGEFDSYLDYNFSNKSYFMIGRYSTSGGGYYEGRPLLVAVWNKNSRTCYTYEKYTSVLYKNQILRYENGTPVYRSGEIGAVGNYRVHERFELFDGNFVGNLVDHGDYVGPVMQEGEEKINRLLYSYTESTHDYSYSDPTGYNRRTVAQTTGMNWYKTAAGQYVVKTLNDDGKATYYYYRSIDYSSEFGEFLEDIYVNIAQEGENDDFVRISIPTQVILYQVVQKDESAGGTGDYTEILYEYGEKHRYNEPYQIITTQHYGDQAVVTQKNMETNSRGLISKESFEMTEEEAQNPAPYETRYEYYGTGTYTFEPSEISYLKDGQWVQKTVSYNDKGLPSKVTDEAGNETFLYYENTQYPWLLTKQVVNDINKDGGNVNSQTLYEYGDSYLLGPTKVKVLGENGQYAQTTYEYEGKYGNVTKQIDAKGGITQYEYDNLGRPTKVVYPEYQAESGLEHVEEEIAYAKRVLFNGQYLQLMHKVSYQVSGDTRTPVTFEKGYYDDYGQALRVENDLGVAIYTYDDYNRIKQYQNPQDNAAGVLTYDYSFDGLGRLTGVTDKNGFNGIIYGPLSKESYFKTGTTVQNQYKEVYDVRGNVLETYSQPQNGTWQKTASFTYSPRGLLLSQADGKGQVTSFAYDNANNLIKTTLADGSETEYTYAKVGDQNGNSPKDMIQKSEGEEFIYHRTYNNLGMLKSAWQSGGEGAHQPYSYTYNLWGGLQSVTDPKGQATTYGYDTAGNATTITKADETLTYKYNQFGKVDLAQRVRNGQTETADYEYSNLGYLTKKTENGKVLTYTYDLYGKVLSMTDQLGMTTAYEYNEKNQITKVTADGKEFTYAYYPNGLVQSLTYPASKNGTKVATNYTYDNAGRLTNVSTPVLNESYSYSYDENSNINGVNNNVEFFYDEVNRIAMSNFKSVGNTQNLYSYDGRGNIKNHVSNKTLPSPKPYTYTYDASNRVKEVTNGNTAVASYDYDMDGIRNKKTVNGTTTEYYTANGNVLAEKTGSTERHNVWTDRILARKDGTTWYYLIYDGLNDVRKVITDSASIVANYTYDEWGNILEKSGSYANQNPIRYKGEYFDAETGFIYLRARYYDPTIGRFITEDPILDGQNWYVYCGANPIMYVDPTGYAVTADDDRAHELGLLSDANYKQILEADELWRSAANDDYKAKTTARLMAVAARMTYNPDYVDDFDYTFNGKYKDNLNIVGATAVVGGSANPIILGAILLFALISTEAGESWYDISQDKRNDNTVIYRWGNASYNNLTPRPVDVYGLSFTTVRPLSGKYLVTTMEAINSSGVLVAVKDGPTHVSVRPINDDIGKWIESRPNSTANPHPYTLLLRKLVMVMP